MARFKDSEGTDWEVRFTLPMVRKLREAGYDLGKVANKGDTLEALGDPDKFGQIMWVACEAQAEKRGLTPEQYAERFDGPTIHAAVEAVYAATADFCHRPAVAAALKTRLSGAMTQADEAMVARVGAMTPNGSNDSATNSPAPPESTPAG